MNNNLKSFTMADRRSSRFHISNIERIAVAFTMAEILLSLTIIGVVAAITLPSLTGNINERTWNTQRKALYARMSQAIALMGSLNGYGISSDSSQTISNAAKVFISDGLSKVLKINNICDYQHFQDCGLPETFVKQRNILVKTLFPTDISAWNSRYNVTSEIASYSFINTHAAAFETANGESIAVFYNPFCVSKNAIYNISTYAYSNQHFYQYIYPYMCVNFIYDLNGKKGPNRVGKDIGAITALYSTETEVVAPLPIDINLNDGTVNYNMAINECKKYEEYKLPNMDEMTALVLNYDLYQLASNRRFITSTINNSLSYKCAWFASPNFMYRGIMDAGINAATTTTNFTCIKR